MITLLIVFSAIIIIALLRFGVTAEYSADGITLFAFVGHFSYLIYPNKKEKNKTIKTKAPTKGKRSKDSHIKPEAAKPGGLKEYLDLLPAIKNTLGRFRRRLLIKTLTMHFVAGNRDPFKTAMIFGSSNTVFGITLPIIESSFRIKHRDFHTSADFAAIKPMIYAKASFSLAVWEAFYITIAILPIIIKMTKKTKKDVQ